MPALDVAPASTSAASGDGTSGDDCSSADVDADEDTLSCCSESSSMYGCSEDEDAVALTCASLAARSRASMQDQQPTDWGTVAADVATQLATTLAPPAWQAGTGSGAASCYAVVNAASPAQTTLQAPDDFRLPSCMAATGAQLAAGDTSWAQHSTWQQRVVAALAQQPGGSPAPMLPASVQLQMVLMYAQHVSVAAAATAHLSAAHASVAWQAGAIVYGLLSGLNTPQSALAELLQLQPVPPTLNRLAAQISQGHTSLLQQQLPSPPTTPPRGQQFATSEAAAAESPSFDAWLSIPSPPSVSRPAVAAAASGKPGAPATVAATQPFTAWSSRQAFTGQPPSDALPPKAPGAAFSSGGSQQRRAALGSPAESRPPRRPRITLLNSVIRDAQGREPAPVAGKAASTASKPAASAKPSSPRSHIIKNRLLGRLSPMQSQSKQVDGQEQNLDPNAASASQ